jgi:hypothetical protein
MEFLLQLPSFGSLHFYIEVAVVIAMLFTNCIGKEDKGVR